jgi:hypothetical protein
VGIDKDILSLNSNFIKGEYIKFSIQNESYLRPNTFSKVDIVFWNKKVFGYGSFYENEKQEWRFNYEKDFKEIPEFSDVSNAIKVVKIDSKIYLVGTVKSEGEEQASTKLWVYNTDN